MKTDRNKFCDIRLLTVIVLLLIVSHIQIISQEIPATEEEFPIGSFLSIIPNNNNRLLFEKYNASGMNTIVPRADNSTKDYLTDLTVIPWNQKGDEWGTDWIQYYITGYYSKWEAEENQLNDSIVGVKHNGGQQATWVDTVDCWSSIGLSSPQNSILYGPDYHQEKVYRRFLIDSSHALSYTPRIRMALNNPQQVPGSEEVCRIKVVFRYKIYHSLDSVSSHDITFLQRTLTVSDFNADSSFKDFLFGAPNTYTYQGNYPENEQNYNKQIADYDFPIHTDLESLTGIQFSVDWLRTNDLCTLYVDYAEVYDNKGWNNFVEDPLIADLAIQNIIDYTLSYSNWDNIKYWYGHDEPYTLDAIVPMKVVDQIVRSAGGAPVVTAQLIAAPEHWSPTNGIWLHQKIYDEVQPAEVMFDYYPFYEPGDTQQGLEILRTILEETHRMKPGFWYIGQAFGTHNAIGEPCMWRTPDTTEVKASIMLSLAHGTKGVLFWNFESGVPQATGQCFTRGILDLSLNETDFYYLIKNNLAPRLKGKLGKALLRLNYTGSYINFQVGQPEGMLYHEDYLSLVKSTEQVSYHAGLLNHKNDINNKYFLVTNLLTAPDQTRYCTLYINYNRTLSDFTNWRVKNVEGVFDETFLVTNHLMLSDTLTPGEGHLFQVAPVIKYGGKLIANETAGNGMTLYDAMTIESGATLTVNGTYNINANIEVKDGAVLQVQPGASLVFYNGAKLIVNGGLTAVGTSANKITFDFTDDQSDNGILTEDEDFLSMSNCIIKNAMTGLSIMHNSRGTAVIRYNKFENCVRGISIVNLTSALIQGNEFINTQLGILTSNVSELNIISNLISSNNSYQPGILLNSSSGYVRKNTISGHLNGIEFGNSSPYLGTNTIYNNVIHGLHIGPGSQPNLQAEWIQVPCTNVPIYSPFVGVNNIYNNGGNTTVSGDDGAEIYIENSNILLADGCNGIADSREETEPPYNTRNLICSEKVISIDATNNYWGSHPTYTLDERFCSLSVIYEPEGCILPDIPIDCEIIAYTSDGIAIDTFHVAYVTDDEDDELRELYADAETFFAAGDYTQASQVYNEIITDYSTQRESFDAYSKLLVVERLRNSNPQAYEVLKNLYLTNLNNITDTLMTKMIIQLANLCLVNGGALIEAADAFQNIINNNPGSEEAYFAEIDLYTTALLDTSNTLNKGGLEKVTASSFNEKLNNLLIRKYGKPNIKTEEKIIPKEYLLYQNYPNPFNPTTTIKFDLPKDGMAELVIYDILGRRITKLVSEFKPAGSYEQRFDASNLASGIYIYQLKSGDFLSTKKMLMIK